MALCHWCHHPSHRTVGARRDPLMELPPLPSIPLLQIERAVAPISFPDPFLEQALQGVLFPPGSPRGACQHEGGARYVFNRVDLDGDRQPETLVAVLGQRRCGQHGCPLVLLRSDGERLVPLQTFAGLRSSLVVSERRSHGWLDLILPPADGTGDRVPLRLKHIGARYPAPSEREGTLALRQPTRGVATLALKPSPYLVQGHSLPCPPPQGDQRNRVLSRDPNARPRSSLGVVPVVGAVVEPEVVPVEASRPSVWVATRLMSDQRKIPVTP